jgi:hypothetical protein
MIKLPSGPLTRVTFTRVAAHASASVPSTVFGASTSIGFAPRPLA